VCAESWGVPVGWVGRNPSVCGACVGSVTPCIDAGRERWQGRPGHAVNPSLGARQPPSLAADGPSRPCQRSHPLPVEASHCRHRVRGQVLASHSGLAREPGTELDVCCAGGGLQTVCRQGWRQPSLQGRTCGVSANRLPRSRPPTNPRFAGKPAPTVDSAASPPSCRPPGPAMRVRTCRCSRPRRCAPDCRPACRRRTDPTAARSPTGNAPGNSCD